MTVATAGDTVKLRGFFLGQFRDCLEQWQIVGTEARRMLDSVIRAVAWARQEKSRVVATRDGFKLAVSHVLQDGRKVKMWVLFESDESGRQVVVRMIEAHIIAASPVTEGGTA
jgi:CTP synthase (UTP-ammonia lyase)